MKKIGFLFLLIGHIIFAQTAEEKVWDLLLNNKRAEARKLYDKEFKNSSKSLFNLSFSV